MKQDLSDAKEPTKTRPAPSRRATVSGAAAEEGVTKRKTAPRPVVRRSTLGASGKSLLKGSVEGDSGGGGGGNLKVVVRKRPAAEGEEDCVTCSGDMVLVKENKLKLDLTPYVEVHKYCYDNVFGEEDSTSDLYEQAEVSRPERVVPP
jgi:hypothetical protein